MTVQWPNRQIQYELPAGKITKAREEFVNVLQKPNMPVHRYIKNWSLGTGTELDNLIPAEWALELLPLFRFEMGGGEANWFNEVTHKVNIEFNFLVGFPTRDQRTVTNFYEAMLSQLYPGDKSLYLAMKKFGVMSYTTKIVGVQRFQFQDCEGQVARGQITLLHELRTQY